MDVATREKVAIEHVTERLIVRYRDRYSKDQVSGVITAAHRRFEGGKIRTFVPVLVEKEARAQLEHRQPAS